MNEPLLAKKITIASGKFTVFHGDLPVVSLGNLEGYFPQPLAGILGFDVIGGHTTVLDFRSDTFSIYKPHTFQEPTTSRRLKMRSCSSSPMVDVGIRLGNRDYVPASLLVDSGSQLSAELSRPFVDAHEFASLRGLQPSELDGVGGPHAVLKGLPLTIRFLPDEPEVSLSDAYLSRATEGRTSTAQFDGTLGDEAFRNSAVIFNCPDGYIALD